MPLYSTDFEVQVCLEEVKRTKRFRLFLEYLSLHCLNPTLLHEDNTVVNALIKANKMTFHLRYIDIPLCHMRNEYNLQIFDVHYYKSSIMLSNFLTKALSVPFLL